jgi:hypothetical protein
MGFFGIGPRSVGSRHLRDESVITRTIGSDAITSDKIAPETILEIDIAPGAVGSSEIAANAISYVDQVKDDLIGSRHIGANAIAYAEQLIDNIIGFAKLTLGLQGSFVGVSIETGRIGSLTTPVWTDRSLGSYDITQANYYYGMTFLPDKNRIVVNKTDTIGGEYLVEIGTTIGNLIGSVKFMSGIVGIPYGLVLATDKNKFWVCVSGAAGRRYVYNIGTTTGNVIGSFVIPTTGRDITFSDETGHLFVSTSSIIYEIGTTTGNVVGSWTKSSWGLAFNSDHGHLFYDDGAYYIHEIGTTDGRELGSYKGPRDSTQQILFFDPDNILDVYAVNDNYVNKIGTNFGRAYSGTYVQFSSPFPTQPSVTIGQIDDIGNKSVFIMEPTVGSFWLKAGTYPAKAMWMAVG